MDKINTAFDIDYDDIMQQIESFDSDNKIHLIIHPEISEQKSDKDNYNDQTEILFITSYPPRECGIATYSQDLIKSLQQKFSNSLSVKVCALESNGTTYSYPDEVKYILKTSLAVDYRNLSTTINEDDQIKIVLIQHEFGFFIKQENAFLQFLNDLSKPVIIVFHTVLPHPDEVLKSKIRNIVAVCKSIIVMTHTSADILINDYGVIEQKITVIAHGTHLVPHLSKLSLKKKYGLKGKSVLTTFGLLSSGKSIETTLNALPAIVEKHPEVVFLIIGKTHPEVVKMEGEKYRDSLKLKVKQYNLENHVIFINKYLELTDLLEYLQLTDIYLFTSSDPSQAVSGTFVYAMSCGCPIISTPIPHAKELLSADTGIIFDFHNYQQLSDSVMKLLIDNPLREHISTNTLQKIVSSSWENSAVAHAFLFKNIADIKIKLKYNLPEINLNHLKQMTTDLGIIQFSKINHPDIRTGYTLDDNARALIASCMYFELLNDQSIISEIKRYLHFIKFCQQTDGMFLNYVDKDHQFTDQNLAVNLEDANGRAVWALGYVVSLKGILPGEIVYEADAIIKKSINRLKKMHSSRAMAFSIKGLYYYNRTNKTSGNIILIKTFADRLVQMYEHESNPSWEWFESYLTYANSVLPEAMLYAWLLTKDPVYKKIADSALDFLLTKIFNKNGIEVISNRTWLLKGQKAKPFGEQPIDVAYTIMSLSKFYDVTGNENYYMKMDIAFNWFLGKNRLKQIVYNPCTGGCYDGLEEMHVNLNQGAESTVSYLMARLCMEKYKNKNNLTKVQLHTKISVSANKRKPFTSPDYSKQPYQPDNISLPLYMK